MGSVTATPDASTAPPPGPKPAVIVKDLHKHYGHFRALDGISFTVTKGEIFALLGTNGAGKSTAIEILEGYHEATSGHVEVLGFDPRRDAQKLKERMGLTLQATALYQELQVGEMLQLFCSFYRNPADPRELAKLVDLEHHWDHRFVGLSGGEKQRLALGLALAGNPELIFLDEPTAAMDPKARVQTHEIIKNLRDRGVTMMLTTHFMDEAQLLADYIVIIDKGRIIIHGTPDQIVGSGTEIVSFSGPEGLRLDHIREIPVVGHVVEAHPGSYSMTCEEPLELVAHLAGWSKKHQIKVTGLHVMGTTLEDIFLQATKEDSQA
jgi:ABC-2 type transport system ATP-binding protein